MDGGQGQPVGAEHPENNDCQQHQRQHPDLTGGHGKNVADEILIVLGKAAAAHGGDKDAQSHGSAGKHADQRIRRLIGAAADEGEQQGKGYAESHSRPGGSRHAADRADGNARKRRMSQRVGEEAHAPGDDHGGQQAEQGRHQQQSQQGVLHKIPVQHLKGEKAAKPVPNAHALPPFMWKVRLNSSEFSTVSGSP